MNNPLVSQRDPDIERRRALVKVYMLLLRLAEEAERKVSDSDAAVPTRSKAGVPVSTGVVSSSQ